MATENARKSVINEAAAADFLGYARTTIRQSRWTGTLAGYPAPPSIKIGRSVRYRPEDLEKWLEQYAKEVTS